MPRRCRARVAKVKEPPEPVVYEVSPEVEGSPVELVA